MSMDYRPVVLPVRFSCGVHTSDIGLADLLQFAGCIVCKLCTELSKKLN